MILKDTFYRIIAVDSNENTHLFNIALDASHRIFSGHFPGNPVTPGVVQMEIIKELASEVTGRPLNLHTMSNCKFLAILNPQDTPEIQIRIDLTAQEADLKVNAVISAGEITYLKISAVYGG